AQPPPVPPSLPPCCLHIPPLRMKTHTAPAKPSDGPPTAAVLPSADSATEKPCPARAPPVPTSLACWLQNTPTVRMKTHAAPALLLSFGPPTTAVLPAAESATDVPCWMLLPTVSVPNSLACWLHAPPLRVNTHAAPAPLLSVGPPTMAVLPSAESATD